MATTSARFPGSAINVARGGTNAWTNPGNATADDATDTTGAVPTDYLVCSNFGFTVRTPIRILGVRVAVEASETGSGTSDYMVQLISDTTPTLIGNAKGPTTVSGTSKVVSTNGSITDTWGATLNSALINSSGFGCAIWSTDTVNTLAIDYVTIQIEFTPTDLPALGCGG
jgi:hypothetical protein